MPHPACALARGTDTPVCAAFAFVLCSIAVSAAPLPFALYRTLSAVEFAFVAAAFWAGAFAFAFALAFAFAFVSADLALSRGTDTPVCAGFSVS